MRALLLFALAAGGCQAWPHGQDPDGGGQVPDGGAPISALAGAGAGVTTYLPIIVTPATAEPDAGR